MAYFDGIRVGDRVWSVEYNYGKVVSIWNNCFVVQFENYEYIRRTYNFNGVKNGCYKCNQTLFWDKIEFEIPKKPKIKLKEDIYLIEINHNCVSTDNDLEEEIELGLARNDKETADKALKQIKRFTKLLALRDQECHDSRGYEFRYGLKNFAIFKNIDNTYFVKSTKYAYNPTIVYFKTEEDAQKICDILNSGRFDLEGE